MMNPVVQLRRRIYGLVVGLTKRSLHQRFEASQSAPYERPTPVVLFGGEGLGLSIWGDFIKRFSSEGYSGVAIPLSSSLQTSEDMVTYLKCTVEDNQMTPPLLVAHSAACYAAIQYLESHSLSGLVLLNPLPINPAKAAAILSTKYADCSSTAYQSELGQSASALIRRYYGVSGPDIPESLLTDDPTPPGFPKNLMRDLASSRQTVLLEACSVPACVIMTAGDDALFDLAQEQALLDLFGIESGESTGEAGVDDMGMSSAVNESPSFLRLKYNLSRLALTSEAALMKCMTWTNTFM